ncbi:hypothetical protein [Leptolyngbya sp. 7M]|uniref:hypothetical protein n=1 Tax=Leptolyngbya sp. 7M TaxID=2812896 RepID=UPI001B8AE3A1|nr:hypothetical protein [Leptolyngbya sp. 7M]QYO65452.1 hypothetical protein JVX88_01300 [Leptolyngbya sp. 7M]
MIRRRKNLFFAPFLLLLGMALGCSNIERVISERSSGDPSAANTAEQPSSATSDATSETSAARFEPSGDPKEDIQRMSDRFLALDSFRAEMTGTGKTDMKAEMDFLAPDRFRLKTGLPNGQSTEMIVIGKDTYLNVGGRWQKMGVDIGTSMPNMRETFSKEGLKWFKEIRFEGEDTAEGQSAYRYSYSGTAPGGGNEYTSRIWVRRSDGLPIKVDADYKTGDLRTMTILYDYATKIVIEPPTGK